MVCGKRYFRKAKPSTGQSKATEHGQHDCTAVPKARFIKKWLEELIVEDLDRHVVSLVFDLHLWGKTDSKIVLVIQHRCSAEKP